ncbi:MAG: class I SAM-dependent methyltransferase [Salinivirgaceae bacterium]|nr:class I SAM-dependent methyltransferase [Salinivirgaceae bacterium]
MNFYQSIAHLYDYIFPLNKNHISFVQSAVTELESKSIIDIGCGTGSFAIELGKYVKNIVGIDLDEEMLQMANAKNNLPNVVFEKGDMLHLAGKFENSFDSIICFGNTLVHLESFDEIDMFLKQCKCILHKGGKLLIQIINYDRIIDNNIDGLPTIENNFIKFERFYEHLPEEELIDFKTKLTDKKNKQILENSQMLYPITQGELVCFLEKNLFRINNIFGDFNRGEFDKDSISLIIEAESK